MIPTAIIYRMEIIPNRGARVTGISQKDVRDIYQMRYWLEGLAARWAAEHMKEEQIAELEEVVYLSEFHLKDEKQDKIVRLDGRFHEIIYRATASRMLEHVLRDFHYYVKNSRGISVKSKKRAEESVKEHKAILDAIRNRDGALAEKLANEHIGHVIENLEIKVD